MRDKDTLIYFETHPKIGSLDDFIELWKLKGCTMPKLDDLNKTSRAMSIIRLHYPDPSIQLQILECIQTYKPVYIIEMLGDLKLTVEEMQHFMQKLMEQEESIRSRFLSLTKSLCSLPKVNKKVMVDWLCQIEESKREHLVRGYLIVAQKLGNDESQLSKIRQSPDFLEGDFDTTLSSLDNVLSSLHANGPKIS